MAFPPLTTMFWLTTACFLFSGNIFLALSALFFPLLGSLTTYRKIHRIHSRIGFLDVLPAVIRSYGAWMYHLCAFVSRYYILFCLVFTIFWPLVFYIMLVMHCIACLGQYVIKKPGISLLTFFFYFTLEQISYQTGVWWSCLKNNHFGSIFPKLSFSISHTL